QAFTMPGSDTPKPRTSFRPLFVVASCPLGGTRQVNKGETMQRIRTSLVSALAFAVVALVAFARPPAPTPGPAPTPPIAVPPGVDLLQATGTFHLSLPSGFFGSGSNAYSGDLAASGA